MLTWAATFFVVAIIAGFLGFTNIAGSALAMAQILFFVFLVGAFALLICGLALTRKIF
jgi:uncharacterized membrane protein YtjA (UPF0391 family)